MVVIAFNIGHAGSNAPLRCQPSTKINQVLLGAAGGSSEVPVDRGRSRDRASGSTRGSLPAACDAVLLVCCVRRACGRPFPSCRLPCEPGDGKRHRDPPGQALPLPPTMTHRALRTTTFQRLYGATCSTRSSARILLVSTEQKHERLGRSVDVCTRQRLESCGGREVQNNVSNARCSIVCADREQQINNNSASD